LKIQNKADWSHVYTAETAADYMLFSLESDYFAPEYAMGYLRPLFTKLSHELQRPLNLMDLGSSYGIISTLALYNLTWSELIDFYVKDNQLINHSWQDIEHFYLHQLKPAHSHKFYLLDSSKPAIEFSIKMNLCEKGYVLDIKNDPLTDELKNVIQQIDVFICVGSISYFGANFFAQMLKVAVAKGHFPLLAFSTYPALYYKTCASDIESEFQKYGYEFICCNVPTKGRRMNSEEYETSEKNKYYQAFDICKFENEGYYTSAFYIAVPQNHKNQFENWMVDVESNFSS